MHTPDPEHAFPSGLDRDVVEGQPPIQPEEVTAHMKTTITRTLAAAPARSVLVIDRLLEVPLHCG